MGESIGSKLIKLRGDKSQSQVAKDLGISDSALSAYELNLRIPRDEIKMKISDYYGVSISSIFFDNK